MWARTTMAGSPTCSAIVTASRARASSAAGRSLLDSRGGGGEQGPGAGAARLVGRDQGEGASEGVGVVGVTVGEAVQDRADRARRRPRAAGRLRCQLGGGPQVQLDPPVEPAGQLGCCRSLDEQPGVVGVAVSAAASATLSHTSSARARCPSASAAAPEATGLPAGGDGGRQGTLDVAGGRPVVGDLPSRSGLRTSSAGGEAGVQPCALAWDELVVADLAGELVPEPSDLAAGEQRRRPQADAGSRGSGRRRGR